MDKEQIYLDYHGKVFGYIRSRLNDTPTAEDLASDVFVKVYEKLDTFDETRASISTWIFTITRNTVTDYFRTRRTFSEIPEALADDGFVAEEIENEEMLETLAQALGTLETRLRDILILHYYSGKTLKEIAAKMGLSYAYVKVLQNKALEKLKKFFENQ